MSSSVFASIQHSLSSVRGFSSVKEAAKTCLLGVVAVCSLIDLYSCFKSAPKTTTLAIGIFATYEYIQRRSSTALAIGVLATCKYIQQRSPKSYGSSDPNQPGITSNSNQQGSLNQSPLILNLRVGPKVTQNSNQGRQRTIYDQLKGSTNQGSGNLPLYSRSR